MLLSVIHIFVVFFMQRSHHKLGNTRTLKLKGDFYMKCTPSVFLLSLLLIPVYITPSYGLVEWDIKTKINVEATPRDVAVSLNDKWVFVLNDKGEILVYSKEGTLKEKMAVGKHVDQIKVGPRENLIFLSSRQNQTVEVVELDFIQTINTVGSPFKGPADAQAVIAVFDDFQ